MIFEFGYSAMSSRITIKIGRLFQDPMKGSAPGMTVEENLALAAGRGGWLSHVSKADKKAFRERVALLDGGINQWMKEGRELSTELTQSVPCVFDIARRDWVVSTESVLANINKEGFCLIDARSPDRFRGENETLDPVGGHIPGARNRFFRDNLDDKGCFRHAAELRRDFLELLAGVEADKAVMQCGSGVTACHNLFAMSLAGYPLAPLYAGSWREWITDPARPVATGD